MATIIWSWFGRARPWALHRPDETCSESVAILCTDLAIVRVFSEIQPGVPGGNTSDVRSCHAGRSILYIFLKSPLRFPRARCLLLYPWGLVYLEPFWRHSERTLLPFPYILVGIFMEHGRRSRSHCKYTWMTEQDSATTATELLVRYSLVNWRVSPAKAVCLEARTFRFAWKRIDLLEWWFWESQSRFGLHMFDFDVLSMIGWRSLKLWTYHVMPYNFV